MHLFGKKKKQPEANPHETITKLKENESQLTKRKEVMEHKANEETKKIKQLLATKTDKNKKAALMCLKRKQMYEKSSDDLDKMTMNLPTQILTLENAEVNMEAFKSQQMATRALKQIHEGMDIDAGEITAALTNPLHPAWLRERVCEREGGAEEDEDDLWRPALLKCRRTLAELEGLEQEQMDLNMEAFKSQQVSNLSKRKEVMEHKANEEIKKIKQLLATKTDKNKKAALMCLKRKKMYEKTLDDLDEMTMNLATQILTLENAKVNVEAFKSQQMAIRALKQIHEGMDIDAGEIITKLKETEAQLTKRNEVMVHTYTTKRNEETKKIKQLLATKTDKNKKAALMCLKRKKMYEKTLDDLDEMTMNLATQILTLENAKEAR